MCRITSLRSDHHHLRDAIAGRAPGLHRPTQLTACVNIPTQPSARSPPCRSKAVHPRRPPVALRPQLWYLEGPAGRDRRWPGLTWSVKSRSCGR